MNSEETNSNNKKTIYQLLDIHVISLKRSQDRKVLFEKNNSKYLHKYFFYEAVDGNQLDINKIPTHIYDRRATGYTKGALGCALSHYQLWEKCVMCYSKRNFSFLNNR